MGGAKRKEEYERRCEAAIKIALGAGVLQQCEYHEECIFKGAVELENAYLLANDLFSQGGYVQVFKDSKEMTASIKEVVADHSMEECSSCGRSYEE